jgi:anoctamin-10
MISDGGIGIIPGSKEWDRVDSVLGLHDHKFNEMWIRSWTTKRTAYFELEKIREQVLATLHK